MKRVLIVILLFVISFSLWAVDWTSGGSDGERPVPRNPEPVAYVTPRAAIGMINLASTSFRYQNIGNLQYNGTDGEGFQDNDQIAVASVLGLTKDDIESGTTVTIRVDCPTGFEFISESNPSYRRPFNIVVAVSYGLIVYNDDGTSEYRVPAGRYGRRLTNAGAEIVEVVTQDLPQNFEGDEFWVLFDVLLELEGDVANGQLEMPDGTTYPLANLNDYSAAVTVSISCDSANVDLNQSLTLPFSGYYDSRGESVAAVSSLSVNPTARASNLRLDEEQGQPVDVAAMNFMRMLQSGGIGQSDPESYFDTYKTRIFFSSSANPEIDGGKFKFVHDAVQPGDLLDDRNSIQYEVRAVDSDSGSIVTFDGTMTRVDMENSSEGSVIIPRNVESKSHPNYGQDVIYWQEYNGTIQVVLERKYNMMYAGAYKSYVYVHVYVEDGV